MRSFSTRLIIIFFSFLMLSNCFSGYKVKDGKVYHKWINGGNWTRELILVDSADASTFKKIKHSLNIDLGKDKNYVYNDGSILKDADPSTFEHVKAYYWKDKNNVYLLQFGDKKVKIEGADPITFSVIKNYSWAKDKKIIYYEFNNLLGVNPENFIAIDEEWGKDNHHYFWHNGRIDSLDFDTAEIISGYYIKDKNKVFFENKIVKDANPSTFKADGVGTFGHDDKFMFDRDINEGLITDKYRNTYIGKK